MLLGCIADDSTGATDLASTLVAQGMRTVQAIGVPDAPFPAGEADAVVVALKTRTAPAADAVRRSREALDWLRRAGARQFFFKYCSTFDSTDDGNIGPVADALLDALGQPFALACPAYPTNGRTLYKGYLFVGDVLLSESGMRDHPLTPMTDPNLVRVLARQTKRRVGLVDRRTVAEGTDAIAAAFRRLRADGAGYAIVDALDDRDLFAIGRAADGMALVTGGSGAALGLPENFRRAGLLAPASAAAAAVLPPVDGAAVVLAGSCSEATRGQVAAMAAGHPAYTLDPLALAADAAAAREAAVAWAAARLGPRPILIYSTAEPAAVRAAQATLGREAAGRLVEEAMGAIAAALVERGARRLVVAGGETAGAVVDALGIRALRIGAQIDPGVPWTATLGPTLAGEAPLALALKSGNFGTRDFFVKAFDRLNAG